MQGPWRKDSGQRDVREPAVFLLSLLKQIIDTFNLLWEREKLWLYMLAFACKQKAMLKTMHSSPSRNWVLNKFVQVRTRERFPVSVSMNRKWLKKQLQEKAKIEEISTNIEKGRDLGKGPLRKKCLLEKLLRGQLEKHLFSPRFRATNERINATSGDFSDWKLYLRIKHKLEECICILNFIPFTHLPFWDFTWCTLEGNKALSIHRKTPQDPAGKIREFH